MEITCTGMCRVRGLRFRRSRMLHPSTTGSWMSSVMAFGCSSFASARPVSPRVATTALKRSEEHTSELQSQSNLVCRLLLEKKKENIVRVIDHQTHAYL